MGNLVLVRQILKFKILRIQFSVTDNWFEDPNELGLCDLEDGTSMCLKCNKSFSCKLAARTHYKEQHQLDRNQKKHICSICQNAFEVKRYLVNHMKRIHGVSQKMFKNSYVPVLNTD